MSTIDQLVQTSECLYSNIEGIDSCKQKVYQPTKSNLCSGPNKLCDPNKSNLYSCPNDMDTTAKYAFSSTELIECIPTVHNTIQTSETMLPHFEDSEHINQNN